MEIRRSISDLHEKLIKTINGIQLKAAAAITFSFPFSLACFLPLELCQLLNVYLIGIIFTYLLFGLPLFHG